MSPLRRAVGSIGVALACAGVLLVATDQASARFYSIATLVAQFTPVSLPSPAGRATPAAEPTSAAPAAAPSAPPQARRKRRRTTFGLTGTASANQQVQHQASGSQAQLTNVLGMLGSLNNRGEHTALELRLPASISTHTTAVGNLEGSFTTPRYALTYRNEALAPFGQLGVGNVPRAFGVSFKTRRGIDTQVIGGSAVADGSRGFRVAEIRQRYGVGRGILSLGAIAGSSNDGGARFSGLIGGYSTVANHVDGVVEAALTRTSGMLLSPNSAGAFSYQGRINVGGQDTYASYVQRQISPSFIGVGGGTTQGDRYRGLSYRTRVHDVNVSSEAVFETINGDAIAGGDSTQVRESLTLGRLLGRGQVSLNLQSQRQLRAGDRTWTGTGTTNIGFPVGRSTFLSESFSIQRGTSLLNGPSTSTRYGLSGTRDFALKIHAELELSRTRELATQAQALNINVARIALSRSFKLFDASVSDTITRNTGNAIDTTQSSLLFALGRRLNAGTSIRLQYGIQSTRSRLANLATPGGPSTYFNLSVGAPFALGNGERIGRSDPRLPAAIRGSVVNSNPAFGVSGNAGGVDNVTVVLDGGETARTDYLGNFEFPFVTPGRHEVALDPTALPRGVTPDFPFLTVNVDGGTTARVALAVSTSAAIEGHIYARGPNGARIPVPNVAVELDRTTRSTSGPNGGFGFGHITSGEHEISLLSNTLPADFGVYGELVRKVTAKIGETTILDFSSAPLGSIGGRVAAPKAFKDVEAGGLLNVYVVANPGDHAAITDNEGYFVIDNLPPGTYAVAIDPDTLPDGAEQQTPPKSIVLDPGGKIQDVAFEVGEKIKEIVFSFHKSEASTASLAVQRGRLPPGGGTTVSLVGSAPAQTADVKAFGRIYALDSTDKLHWKGRLRVPMGTPKGTYELLGTLHGATPVTATSSITVDEGIPLANFQLFPARPQIGQYVMVRARFLTDVLPGALIRWQDGAVTELGKQESGRVYTFSVKVTSLPYSGVLKSESNQFPVSLTGR